jgi:hypothetical protein
METGFGIFWIFGFYFEIFGFAPKAVVGKMPLLPRLSIAIFSAAAFQSLHRSGGNHSACPLNFIDYGLQRKALIAARHHLRNAQLRRKSRRQRHASVASSTARGRSVGAAAAALNSNFPQHQIRDALRLTVGR